MWVCGLDRQYFIYNDRHNFNYLASCVLYATHQHKTQKATSLFGGNISAGGGRCVRTHERQSITYVPAMPCVASRKYEMGSTRKA